MQKGDCHTDRRRQRMVYKTFGTRVSSRWKEREYVRMDPYLPTIHVTLVTPAWHTRAVPPPLISYRTTAHGQYAITTTATRPQPSTYKHTHAQQSENLRTARSQRFGASAAMTSLVTIVLAKRKTTTVPFGGICTTPDGADGTEKSGAEGEEWVT